MRKYAQEDERKTQSQISCHYNSSSDIFKPQAPGRRPLTAAKRKAKEKKEREEKLQKWKNLKS